LKKILGVVLKIRYYLEAVAQRQNELEKIILNQSQWKDGQALFEDQVDEFEFCVPITNEDSLNDFEQKLATSQSFKTSVVSVKFNLTNVYTIKCLKIVSYYTDT